MFHSNIIKPKIIQKRDCWRTYKYNKITYVEQVAFTFEDKILNELVQSFNIQVKDED